MVGGGLVSPPPFFLEKMKMVPNVVFHTRVRDDSIDGPNPYRWQDVKSEQIFRDKNVLVFSLPGAFTPTCSTYQLPNFEKNYDQFKKFGVDDIYCISVNDAFVMNAWAKQQGVNSIKMLPDGNGEFTRKMGMLVDKSNLGFGMRSWRYAFYAKDCQIINMWVEPGLSDNADSDPYGVTSPESLLQWFSADIVDVFMPVDDILFDRH
jgi:peroxiredoxin